MTTYPIKMKWWGLFVFFVFSAQSTCAEPVKLEVFQNSGQASFPQKNGSLYSQPNPMGMGTYDPRLSGKKSQSHNASPNDSIQLFYAVGEDDIGAARASILKGADPNAQVPGSDMKMLMTAQSAAMTKMLLEQGADPNSTDKNGATPLHYQAGSPAVLEIVPILIGSGADVNAVAPGRDNRTPLHEAGHWYFEGRDHSVGERLLRLLVARGADINAPEYMGKTLLHTAVENDKPDLLLLTLELGADPGIRDAEGYTASDMAKWLKLPSLVKMLNEEN